MDLENKDTNNRDPAEGHKRLKIDSEDSCCSAESTDVLSAQPAHEDLQEEELRKLLQNLVDADPFSFPQWEDQTDKKGALKDSVCINGLMQKSGFVELRMIINWAREVTGYQSLSMEDQIALLKASFLELNVLRMAYRSLDVGPNCILFAGNLTLSDEKAAKMGWGLDLVNCTLDFIKCLKDIHIDRKEFAILNAVVLTYPDAAGIKDKPAVIALQSKLLKCMQQYIKDTYPTDRSRYGKILLKLPLLRTTSAKGAERFLNLTLDGTIEMNALVWEMMNS